jgi:DNA/RNA-binding domain of Phe-tRNA-synthetase-like protein
MRKIAIENKIFVRFPDFKRGIIIVTNIDNTFKNNWIQNLLDQEIENKIGTDYSINEFVKEWDEVHRAFGSNPNKFPPSIKSLLKRIQKGVGFPYINSVVALFNYISIKYLIPCGGDDIDKIEGNLHLGFARGNEIFVALGSAELEKPESGEVIYFDDKTLNVMCRRWNWRNGDFTKITENAKNIVINIDGVGQISKSLVLEARDELAQLLVEQCGASVTTGYLNIENQEILL